MPRPELPIRPREVFYGRPKGRGTEGERGSIEVAQQDRSPGYRRNGKGQEEEGALILSQEAGGRQVTLPGG